MGMEKTEDKVLGYNKRMLGIVFMLLIASAAAFYVGAKYEKNKLSRLGLLKDSNAPVTQTKKTKKQATAVTSVQSNEPGANTPSADGNAPANQPAQATDVK